MAYSKQNFIDGNVLYAESLNNMDNEIVDLRSTASNLTTNMNQLGSKITSNTNNINKFLDNNKVITDILTSINEDGNTVLTIKYSNADDKVITLEGGNSLNFKIVGGITEPDSPTENTIWIQTPYEITEWFFSPQEDIDASNIQEGFLQIITNGDNSLASFNAVKNGNLWVSLTMAQQLINNDWSYSNCYIFQNDEWITWFVPV